MQFPFSGCYGEAFSLCADGRELQLPRDERVARSVFLSICLHKRERNMSKMSGNGRLCLHTVTLGGNECVWLHYVCLLAHLLYLRGFLCNPSGTLDTVCSLKFTPCACRVHA